MRVLIADDEPLARSRLCELLERLPDYLCCGAVESGIEALRLAERLHPDIVLLDIEMPGVNGLEIAQQLSALEQAPAVIFTTAYSEYALAAFDANAIAYLLKPVRLERLEQALLRASRPNRAQLNALAATPAAFGERTYIQARIGHRLERIALADIFYFQADEKYVLVQHRRGQALLEESLKSLEQTLGARVMRIHRNALVVTAHIAALEKGADGNSLLVLHGVTERLEVSRRHLPALRQFLHEA